jgi:hypothetical protein
MTQGDIERVREEPVEVIQLEVLDPDEIIEVQSQPISSSRPKAQVRTTEIVVRGLDLLTSLGRLVLRFLQTPDTGMEVSSSSPSSSVPLDRTTPARGASSGQGGRRRRRHRGGS